MSALPASLKVRRYERDPDTFLISVDGYDYEGEGTICDYYDLERVLGERHTRALIDQLDAARTHTEEAA